MAELCDVFCEYSWENWLHYSGIALYINNMDDLDSLRLSDTDMNQQTWPSLIHITVCLVISHYLNQWWLVDLLIEPLETNVLMSINLNWNTRHTFKVFYCDKLKNGTHWINSKHFGLLLDHIISYLICGSHKIVERIGKEIDSTNILNIQYEWMHFDYYPSVPNWNISQIWILINSKKLQDHK